MRWRDWSTNLIDVGCPPGVMVMGVGLLISESAGLKTFFGVMVDKVPAWATMEARQLSSP